MDAPPLTVEPLEDPVQGPLRLLFDENLSEQLVRRLADVYPDSVHLRTLGRAGIADRAVWALARELGCLLVTRDEDFVSLATLLGAPPKVVLIERPNPSNAEIEALLRHHVANLAYLQQHDDATVLLLR